MLTGIGVSAKPSNGPAESKANGNGVEVTVQIHIAESWSGQTIVVWESQIMRNNRSSAYPTTSQQSFFTYGLSMTVWRIISEVVFCILFCIFFAFMNKRIFWGGPGKPFLLHQNCGNTSRLWQSGRCKISSIHYGKLNEIFYCPNGGKCRDRIKLSAELCRWA
jgi:hypothetical protein